MTISGTKEAGADVTISINGGPAITPDTVGDTTWSATVTGLKAGANTIAVTANPIAPLPTAVSNTASAAVNVAFPSGVISGGSSISVNDALKSLKIALGIVQPTDIDKVNRGRGASNQRPAGSGRQVGPG